MPGLPSAELPSCTEGTTSTNDNPVCFSDLDYTVPDGGPPPLPGAPAPPPIVVTAEELASLPIDSGGLSVQPGRGWVLVNKETIAYTGAADQSFTTQILGVPVDVRVSPVDHTWDYGDGTVTTTTEPGAPWPDHTVHHAYAAAHPARQIALTTRWSGEYRVPGSSAWLPVDGLATTSETSAPFEVREYDTRLTTRGR